MTTDLAEAIAEAAERPGGDLIAAATAYAAHGLPVFPCRPGGKLPLISSPHPRGSRARNDCHGECGRWGHGCHDATTDIGVVCEWWDRCPRANIGLATGAPGPDVVDVDTKHGAPGMASLERLMTAGLVRGPHMLVSTASGGVHLYFAGSDQGNGAMPRVGIDFRGRGGYVLAAPSRVDTGDYAGHYQITGYRDATAGVDWSAIRRYFQPPQRTRQYPTRPARDSDYGALVRYVTKLPEGGRNDGLYWASCRALETGAGQDTLDELVDAAVGIGLPEPEARRTVSSAQSKAAAGRLRGVRR